MKNKNTTNLLINKVLEDEHTCVYDQKILNLTAQIYKINQKSKDLLEKTEKLNDDIKDIISKK